MELFDNLSYQGKKPNFVRDQFNTLLEMKNFPEVSLDEGHISFCLETGKRYKYSSQNSNDVIFGKWRLVVDAALDTTSENPVQNKLIANEFKITKESIQELETEVNRRIDILENKFNGDIVELNEKLETKFSILNQRITDEIEAVNRTIERIVIAKVQEEMSKVEDNFDIKFEQMRVDLIQLIEELFETYEPDEETVEKLWVDTKQLEIQLGVEEDLMPDYPEVFDSLSELRDRLKLLHTVYDMEELVPIKDADPLTIEKVRDMITSIQVTTDLI